LGEKAQQVRSAAQNEIAGAKRGLDSAADAARQSENQQLADARGNPTPPQESRPSAENAIGGTQQAAQKLADIAQSLKQVAAPKSNSPSPSASQPGNAPSGSEGSAQSAQQMARMLDALDQQLRSGQGSSSQSQQASPSQQASQSPQSAPSQQDSQPGAGQPQATPGQSQASSQDSRPQAGLGDALRESADAVAAQLQNERLSNRENAKGKGRTARTPSGQTGGEPNDQGRTQNAATGDSRLPKVSLEGGNEWGRLREQRADDVTQGRRETFDPEFNEAIRAYYRALGKGN
jgi:hypothetical protein